MLCAAAAIAIAGAVELPIVAVLFAKEESAVIAMEVGSVLAYSRLLPQILKTGNNNNNKINSLSLSRSVCMSFFLSFLLALFLCRLFPFVVLRV